MLPTVISTTIFQWQFVYRLGNVHVDTSRYVSGVVLNSSRWSGSPWVAARERKLRSLEEAQQPTTPEIMLHLALPPGWEPQTETEQTCSGNTVVGSRL